MRQFIEKIIDAKGFQEDQSVSDDLYTLQTTQSAAPTSDVALLPGDYLFLTSIYATIDGTEVFCRPTTQNKLGNLLTDTYRKPSDTKPYYTQEATGFKIYHGSGTISSCKLNYLKQPASFSIGKESDLINAGTAVLAQGTTYYVTEDAEYDGTGYVVGDTITTLLGTTDLTSGQVIPASAVTACDLPDKTHESLCQLAAKILLGTISDFNPAAFAEKEAQQSDPK